MKVVFDRLVSHISEGQVDAVGEELTTSDEETVETDKGTSNSGWRSLRNIQRRSHGSLSDTDTDEESADDENIWIGRNGHDHRASKEEDICSKDR